MIGTQSATRMARTVPGAAVTRASAGPTASPAASVPRPRSAADTTSARRPWTWAAKTKSAESAPRAAAARRRFSRTFAASSPTAKLRLSVA
jgi:hypothetical protein